jgi:hypothetical protein
VEFFDRLRGKVQTDTLEKLDNRPLLTAEFLDFMFVEGALAQQVKSDGKLLYQRAE